MEYFTLRSLLQIVRMISTLDLIVILLQQMKLQEGRRPIKLTTRSRFSEAQKACLNSYDSNGMTSTSKKHHLIVSKAAKDTDLTVDQVKVHSLLSDCIMMNEKLINYELIYIPNTMTSWDV